MDPASHSIAPVDDHPQTARPSGVPFAQALKFWLKLGFISFGGPAGQIAIMHRELVEQTVGGIDVAALGLVLLAAFALFRLELGVIPVTASCGLVGLVLRLAGVV